MRPIHLTISGWGPYKGKCDIDFNRFGGKGLFLITGATGAGKTSVFDAVCFALYGDVSGEMREKNSVRSDFADADTATYVELVMEHGGDVYKIYRNPEYERPKKRKTGNSAYTKERENAILYLPDGKVVEGNQEVNRKMQEILVLNLKQFKQISMIAQGEFSRLLMAPSKEKISIFREIFDTGIYEEFDNILRQRAKTLYMDASTLKNKLEQAVRMLSLPDEEFKALKGSENLNFDSIYEYLKDAEKKYNRKVKESAAAFAILDKENTELASKISKAEEHNRQVLKMRECKERMVELDKKKESMDLLEAELKQAQNAGFVMPFYVKMQEQNKQLDKKRENVEQSESQLKELKAEKKNLKKVYDLKDEINAAIRLTENCENMKKQLKQQKSVLEQLKEEMADLPTKYLLQENLCREKHRVYEEADYAYKRGTAGIVARMLEEGKPCPVCGSTNHPAPAKAGDDVLSESQLKELQRHAKDADDKLKEIHAIVVEKTAVYEAEEKKYKELCDAFDIEEEKMQKALIYLEGFEGLSVNESYNRLEVITGRYKELEGFIAEKESYLHKLNGELKQDKDEALLQKEMVEKKIKEYGFDGILRFEENCKSREEQQKMSDTLQNYNEEKRALKELSEQFGPNIDKSIADMTTLNKKADFLEKERQRTLEEQRKWNIYVDSIKRTRESVKEILSELKKVSDEYGYVKDLDNVANGMNSKRLVFEQYVLAVYFEEILRASNIRFMKMTGGRYEMSRMETIGDGRSRDNLEIQVFDYFTGKFRSVKTLSGGESFKASLSLALGMSDVIQAFHGGIRVDTLFVDEGFGTLDSESLDQACETLSTLVEQDRLVGIISHVAELRERIEHQIIVHKTGSGSEIQLVV